MYRLSRTSSVRLSVSPSLLALSLFYLVAYHPAFAQVQVINGTWDWPDQGITVNPGGDHDEGAIVRDLAIYDGGLAVGGFFLYAGGVPAQYFALWNGQMWSILGGGSPNNGVLTLNTNDEVLYLAGGFSSVAGVPAKRIARWDGESWSGFGTGLSWTSVRAVQVWDDGSGSILFAGNDNIVKWDGLAWSLVGGGIPPGTGSVTAMTLFDDGSGSALYICGQFSSVGGVPANRVAKWNGVTWVPLGSGITEGIPNTLAVFDDGSGEKLYIGGDFTEVGGVPAVCVARWDGETWSAVHNPEIPTYIGVTQLRVLDDGDGPALFACGSGVIQKWDGQHWTRYLPNPGPTFTVQMFDGPAGPMLHAGGAIALGEYPNARHTNIARFKRGFACGDFNGDGVVDQTDLGILLASFNCAGKPGCQGDANGDGVVDQQDLGILLAHFGQSCG